MKLRPSLLFFAGETACSKPISRSLALTRVLAARFDITMVTSAAPPRGADLGRGLTWIQVPAAAADDSGDAPKGDRRRTAARPLVDRGRILRDVCRSLQPQVLVVERDAKCSGLLLDSLAPLLEDADAGRLGDVLVCCSVRDDLVRRFDLAHDRDAACLRQSFHAVLVHSDPVFARADESGAARVPVYYTGFVHDGNGEPARRARMPQGTFVVLAGAGPSGEALARLAIEAHALLPPRPWPPLTIVGGALPEYAWRRLQARCRRHPRVQLRRSIAQLSPELARAAGSISDCSYHAAIEVLQSRVPALILPAPGGEQVARARRIEDLGLARVVPAAEVTPRRLAHELALLTEFTPFAGPFDFRGAERSARILEALCDSGTRRRSGARSATAEEVLK